MSDQEEKDSTLEPIIVQINEALKEIKDEQKNQRKLIEQNHKVNMQKFSKLLEYNEISDMTNRVFEKRISGIEELLYEVFKK